MKVNDMGLWIVFLKNFRRIEDGNLVFNLNIVMNVR